MKTRYNEKYFLERDVLIPHLADTIRRVCQKYNLKKVIDIGCGSGQLVKYLNNHRIKTFGCDNSTIAVKTAQKINKKNTIIKAQATRLPFKQKTFDLVTCISVIEHLTETDGEKLIQEAKRILTDKGYLFVVTPNFATPIRLIQGNKWFAYSDKTHLFYYSPDSITQLLKKYGFTKIKFSFFLAYQPSLEWEFPGFLGKLPGFVKKILVYLVFTSPLLMLRNSFWVLAQNEKKS